MEGQPVKVPAEFRELLQGFGRSLHQLGIVNARGLSKVFDIRPGPDRKPLSIQERYPTLLNTMPNGAPYAFSFRPDGRGGLVNLP